MGFAKTDQQNAGFPGAEYPLLMLFRNGEGNAPFTGQLFHKGKIINGV
ncbi:MAG: hypothetical protein JPMHGGIA_01995 [Saprospiraceae bacterium]|nr:hypothetical protein [Saprospiraceae bacterium]